MPVRSTDLASLARQRFVPHPWEKQVSSSPAESVHRPVLLDEVVSGLKPAPGMTLVDGTAGAGGHTAALAKLVQPGGRVIGLDRDTDMIEFARGATQGLPVEIVHAPYSDLGEVLQERGIQAVDGVLLDLGLSSDQLAWEHRGFSFAREGPLDMRFDREQETSAADLVNSLSADELADIFYHLGEERFSRRVARRIVESRKAEGPITTTGRLAALVRSSIPGKWGPIDPSTRVFQALRIAVNQELEHLDETLKRLPEWLKPGGRAAIISFHSLEDRRVKQAFRNDPRWTVITKKPVTASPDEVAQNPRARSAKLRVAERCPTTP